MHKPKKQEPEMKRKKMKKKSETSFVSVRLLLLPDSLFGKKMKMEMKIRSIYSYGIDVQFVRPMNIEPS